MKAFWQNLILLILCVLVVLYFLDRCEKKPDSAISTKEKGLMRVDSVNVVHERKSDSILQGHEKAEIVTINDLKAASIKNKAVLWMAKLSVNNALSDTSKHLPDSIGYKFTFYEKQADATIKCDSSIQAEQDALIATENAQKLTKDTLIAQQAQTINAEDKNVKKAVSNAKKVKMAVWAAVIAVAVVLYLVKP